MALGTRRSHDGSVAEAVEHEPRIEGAPEDAGCREWVDHVIVCGLHEVGLRTVEQLRLAGARVVVLDDDADERFARVVRGWGIPQLPRGAHLTEPLYDAGISGAAAVETCGPRSASSPTSTIRPSHVRSRRSPARQPCSMWPPYSPPP